MSNAQHTMHPNNCMVDCRPDSCTCAPSRTELKLREMMERMAFHSEGWTPEEFQRYARAAIAKTKGEA